MAKITQIFLLFFCCLIFSCKQHKELILGAERINYYYPIIKEKRIAIVGNQTSVIGKTHLVDSLIKLETNVIKVFSPEHGFRGIEDAGKIIEDDIDSKTGIPIISLYGKNKKPSPEQLEGIDIIIFDIQDVGARFYTYISTLHYVMEAAAENNIKLIILDRPNPNGHYIDGPTLDIKYQSFVGMHPIPITHAMTIGEYAQMINGEKWISEKCDLKVIEMKNYSRENLYDLPIRPSPNLPNSIAVNLYPSLCLFEGTNVSVGRGTKNPFQHYGSPYFSTNYSFIPRSIFGSKKPKYENIKCFGYDLKKDYQYLKSINIEWIINAYKISDEKEKFFNTFFDKLAGTDKLRLQIQNNYSIEEIKSDWQEDIVKFKSIRKKYLIYK